MKEVVAPGLELGLAELAGGRWEAARAAFGRALEAGEEPEALEGLSWAAWWLDDAATLFAARERAFRLYKRRGEPAGAARMATWLACDELDFNGATAVASGWLRRAARLLEPLEPGPDHGWLCVPDGLPRGGERRHRVRARAGGQRGRARAALRRGGPRDAGSRARGQGARHLRARRARACAAWTRRPRPRSRARRRSRSRAPGRAVCSSPPASRCATTGGRSSGATGSRSSPSATAAATCAASAATHYGAVHLWRGRWQDAEAELDAAVRDLSRSRPAYVAGALVWLAELRRRQGRAAEAERLLGRRRRRARARSSAVVGWRSTAATRRARPSLPNAACGRAAVSSRLGMRARARAAGARADRARRARGGRGSGGGAARDRAAGRRCTAARRGRPGAGRARGGPRPPRAGASAAGGRGRRVRARRHAVRGRAGADRPGREPRRARSRRCGRAGAASGVRAAATSSARRSRRSGRARCSTRRGAGRRG